MWEQSLVDRKRWAAVVSVILGLAFVVGSILWVVFGWATYLSSQVLIRFIAGTLYAGLIAWLVVSSRRNTYERGGFGAPATAG